MRISCLTLIYVLVSTPLVGRAAPDEPARRSFTMRPDSAHWRIENCEAEFQSGGIIRGKKGNGWLRSVHNYSDFILELDWKPESLGFYDAGVFFRANAPPPGESWPNFFQVNLKTGAEAVLKSTQSDSLGSAATKPGEWNHLKLTLEGKTASCEVNNKPVWKSQNIDQPNGYIALQVEQPQGGVILYREIKITELNSENLLQTNLDGWLAAEGDAAACWKRKGNELICTGAKGPWLRYAKPVKNFNLRLDYLLQEGGNSGVYVRVPEDGAHHGATSGIEVQILDDAAPRYKELKPYQYSGSLYAIVPADPRVTNAAGQWNSLEIECRSDQYVVWQNGVEVIRANGAAAPELLERRLEGFLGLQNHSEEVRFRNIRLHNLGP
jgi:Domain of Unknown Function (DUF1080)